MEQPCNSHRRTAGRLLAGRLELVPNMIHHGMINHRFGTNKSRQLLAAYGIKQLG